MALMIAAEALEQSSVNAEKLYEQFHEKFSAFMTETVEIAIAEAVGRGSNTTDVVCDRENFDIFHMIGEKLAEAGYKVTVGYASPQSRQLVISWDKDSIGKGFEVPEELRR